MFELAHISDPHLGPLPEPTNLQLANKRIFGYVNWRRNRKGVMTSSVLDNLLEDLKAAKPDHLAITGDLVNLALPQEILNAQKWLRSLGPADWISVVQGNHDAYVPGSRLKAEQAWLDYMATDKHLADQISFPTLRVRDQVALIGVNSARATMPFMATGYFLAKQAHKLAEQLDHAKSLGQFRVVIFHHPPAPKATYWHKRLIGASLFRRVIQQHGAELILHGHTHLATRTTIKGPDRSVPVICVPSASQSPGGHKPSSAYNLFRISGEAGDWNCHMTQRGFSTPGEPIKDLGHHQLLGKEN
ncbi:MAG TPA: metallophosphatase [Rhizobiales bacterium]|nr:metallophosphatase [Hyphomicrobiales bacterium]